MRKLRVTFIVGLICVLTISASAQAQIANNTAFFSGITYQNVGSSQASITFQYYNQNNGTPTTFSQTLNSGGATTIFVGSLSGLTNNFNGTVVVTSDQPLVSTIVQIPDSSQVGVASPVRNRAMSNAFRSGAPKLYLASILKNQFSTNSRVTIQNAEAKNVDIRLKIYNAASPGTPYVKEWTNVPAGAGIPFDMGTLVTSPALPASLDGAATIEGFLSGTSPQWSIPASVVASAMELSTTGKAAKAFEAESNGAAKLYMATALCDVFDTSQTAYAVQNISSVSIDVAVKYSNGAQKNRTIAANAKASFTTCEAPTSGTMTSNFSGSATIETTTTNGEMIAIGKVFKTNDSNYSTAFLGERYGSNKLGLPYVRYTSDANFNSGVNQRTNIAIQNVGTAAVSGVMVRYRDKNGNVVGTHSLATINASAKANSTPLDAGSTTALVEFGNPAGNPGGGYGASVTIEAPAGAQLVAIARVSSMDTVTSKQVAEDYNAFQVP